MPKTDGNVSGPMFMEQCLVSTWWFIFPSFAWLTLRFAFERACQDPYNLLPAAASIPAAAWALATLYVLAYVWMLTAYLVTVHRTQHLVPSVRAFRGAWRTHSLKVALMAAALTVEYCPVRFWRAIGAHFGCPT